MWKRLAKSSKTPRLIIALFVLEFGATVAALALFGIASPDTYRTALWQDGSNNNFNSDPATVLYAYANYRTPPRTPFVWSTFVTGLNVVVSVFSMFVMLVKIVANVMDLLWPIFSLIIHTIVAAAWCVSIYGQAGPDYSDPKYPSPSPWFITKPCSVAFDPSNIHGCQMLKGGFAVSVVMLSIFVTHIGLALYSLKKPSNSKHLRQSSSESELEKYNSVGLQQMWELPPTPKAPKTPSSPRFPMTPRTLAFNTLGGKIPRAQTKNA
ncbi:MAG: hypothetical protein M1829_003414 [Trizodia sp. TS-e1964]|nr:MAG: hypothetical protein M1829_003414 [Trizodia sp. TS-e1964]